MDPIFEKLFRIRSYEVDFHGTAHPVSVLNYIQDAAGEHADRLGVSVTDLLPRGITWVLSRLHLRLFRSPGVGEVLRVRTWPSLREGRFTCRDFEVFDRRGEPVALATSSWAVVDLATRRPVRIDDHLPVYPLVAHRAISDDFPTLPRLEAADRELAFRVRLMDLDLNRHVNNAVYAAWALETVPEDVARTCRLAEMEISFRAEAFYGNTIVSRCAGEGEGNALSFIHQLVDSEDGKELTRFRTRWDNRNAGHGMP